MLDHGFNLIFLEAMVFCCEISFHTARAEVLSTRYLLLHLALVNQPVPAEARIREIFGWDASFIVDISDTEHDAQTLGLR